MQTEQNHLFSEELLISFLCFCAFGVIFIFVFNFIYYFANKLNDKYRIWER